MFTQNVTLVNYLLIFHNNDLIILILGVSFNKLFMSRKEFD